MSDIRTEDEKKAAREERAANWQELDDMRQAADRFMLSNYKERMSEESARIVAATRDHEAHMAACAGTDRRHAEFIAAIKEQTDVFVRIAVALEKR